MNSQLYAHLEAYDVDGNNGGDDNDDGDHGDHDDHDDDDDDSGRCSSRSQLFANDTKRLSTTLDVIITIIQQRTKDKNITKQVIAVVPIIGVALLYYYDYCDYCNEEFITSINNWYYLTTVLLFLTIFLTCWNKQNLLFPMRPINRQQKSQEISQEKQLLSPSLLPSPKRSNNDDAVTVSELTTRLNHENMIEKVYDCRRELSRLLGLIGAPPMSLMQTNNDINNTTNNNIDDSINITDVATMSVIDFLEAHVQFILSIDESLYWIKISASLHWGLGPHSQCVERVERAAIATTNCQRRKRSRDREINKDKNQLEPQRKLDTSSILALSSARQNLAKVIVNESQSIVEAITAIDSYIKQQQHCRQGKQQNKETVNTINSDDSKYNHRTNKDDDQLHNDNGGDIIGYVVNNGLLVIPDVVDLVWIKSSRKHIANLLGSCVDYLSTIDCLEVLSVEPLTKSPRSKLNESMWNARNLKEYICGNLLLDNSSKSSSPSISPMTGTSSSTDRKFMMSLIQYRQQLDALNAVLLSCQQYNRHQSSSCSGGGGDTTINDNNPSSNHRHQEQEQEQDITNSVKISWWNQVKELSATCQTLEKEIENRFIPLNEHSQNTDSEEDCREVAPDSCQSLAKDHVLNESHNYEHTEKDELRSVPKHEQDQDRTTTTKTFVFSGKGLTETKQKIVMDSGQMKNQVDTAAASLPPPPPRDIITEQLLVRELQSRIRTVARLRDEENVIVASRVDEYVDEYRESEDDEHHTDEGNNFKDINSNGFLEDRPTVNGDDATVETKREVTTNIFLGASGSLLAELKNNLSSNEFQIDEGYS
jgi:hypothetical protein